MELNKALQNKENININNNYKNIIFSKKLKIPNNYFIRNEFQSFLNINKIPSRNHEQMDSKSKIMSYPEAIESKKEKIKKTKNNDTSNITNNLNTEEGDLDIELNSISTKIPINSYFNLDDINANLMKLKIDNDNTNQEKEGVVKKKSKIKRIPSSNSFFDDIQNESHINLVDNNNNNITHNNTNANDNNCNNYTYDNNSNENINNNITNENIFNDNITNANNITNENNITENTNCNITNVNTIINDISNNNDITNDNINNNYHPIKLEFNMTNFGLINRPNIHSNYLNNEDTTNNKISTKNNKTIIANKNDYQIKRHKSVCSKADSYTNRTINENSGNNGNNQQRLYDEIQKLKKENKRLTLKNNELSLKIRTQEVKNKVNSNNTYNNINQKKLSSHREEFLLQKIKKLESEIIKQKDIITKLTYNKRYNIGIRKIRVNSIIIKGKDPKLKRKNSLDSFRPDMPYCNVNKKNSFISNFNNTLPGKFNKFVKKQTKNSNSTRVSKEELNIHLKPSYSSSKILANKKRYINRSNNGKNNNMNKTMYVYNKDNSINLKLENLDLSNNYRKNMIEKINDLKGNKIDKNKNNEKKNSIEINMDKFNNSNISNINNYKKLGPHKTYGKTSLIMSVINDNLLGNFNLSQYMNDHNNQSNNNAPKKINLKRNSIY